MQRRRFLKTAAVSALAAAGFSPFVFSDDKKKILIGLQVYTVRGIAKKDLAGTLAGVAKIGYRGVEFAGFYDHEPKEVRKMLDDSGLKCLGGNIKLATLQGDEFDRTVETFKMLGANTMTVGSLDFKTTEGRFCNSLFFNGFRRNLRPVLSFGPLQNKALRCKSRLS